MIDYMDKIASKLQEYNTHFTNWQKDPSPANMNTLLGAVDPILNTAVTTFTGGNAPAMKSRAKILAIDAFSKYDPQKSQMNTFLLNQLQPLRRYAAKQNPVHVPEKSFQQMQQILGLERQMTDDLGREPSEVELADRSGFSPTKIKRLKKLNRPSVGYSTYQSEEGELSLPEEFSDREKLMLDFVYNDLPEHQQKIMDWKMGLHGTKPLSNSQIARKLRISPGRVSQLSNDIAKLIEEASGAI